MTRTEEEIHQNIVTLSATLRPVFPPHGGKLWKTGGDVHEAPLDHPFVGAVGRAGCLCGGSTAAGQRVPYMPGSGTAGACPCGGGAHGMGCVGAVCRAARSLPPERLLGPVSEFDLAALCDLEQPAAVP
ncbi:hypothetical protein ACKXF7_03265 [Faecalibacterium sp. 7]|uniref:hypothetical protein n=1 Tax=Faecalibacterium sp. 7 TaxID=3402017 RepID=UPI003C2BD265